VGIDLGRSSCGTLTPVSRAMLQLMQHPLARPVVLGGGGLQGVGEEQRKQARESRELGAIWGTTTLTPSKGGRKDGSTAIPPSHVPRMV
jgi:hypothetical protein